ncbi:MAG: hypothetical protein WD468_01795 [Pirellulales bacterium]
MKTMHELFKYHRLLAVGEVVLLAALIGSAASAETLAEKYPKAKDVFPLIEEHPLLKEILLDDDFFGRLDHDLEFKMEVADRLSDPNYRCVLTDSPPLTFEVNPGSITKWASIQLNYQVEVHRDTNGKAEKLAQLRDRFIVAGASESDLEEYDRLTEKLALSLKTPAFGPLTVENLPAFKNMLKDFLPDEYAKNKDRSLDELVQFYEPYTKMKKVLPVTEQRVIGKVSLEVGLRDGFKMGDNHPQVLAVREEISALSERVLGTTAEMRVRIMSELQTLVKAFQPYGAKVLENPPGHYGVQIKEGFCIILRDFILYDKPDGVSGNGYDAHVQVSLTHSPQRPLPAGFLPAFPGAEGFGTWTSGGRGGKVIYVTNLNPEGPGSLLEALKTPGPRIVLFAVSGSIKGGFPITEPHLTLIGHTAPGEGIELDGSLYLQASDVVIRGIRWRKRPPAGGDIMQTKGKHSGIVFDHCGWAYGADELINFYNGGGLVSGTFQFCTIGPAMENVGGHPFGPTGSGAVSLHHNILCHFAGRAPKAGGTQHDWRNNIIYNCDNGYVRGDGTEFNLINNYIVDKNYQYRFRGAETLYAAGNIREGGEKPVVDREKGRYSRIVGVPYPKQPLYTMPVTTLSAEKVPEFVLSFAGSILPQRDTTDAYTVRSIQDRTGKPVFFIRPPNEVSTKVRKDFDPALYDPWTADEFRPPAVGAATYRDADTDGMPDWWEKEHGFDPSAANDGALDKDGDGYTNVEEFINDTDPNRYVDYTKPENNIHSLHIADCIHSAKWRSSHAKD